jgi:hypothetical protein
VAAVTNHPALLMNNRVRGTEDVTRLVITIPGDGGRLAAQVRVAPGWSVLAA